MCRVVEKHAFLLIYSDQILETLQGGLLAFYFCSLYTFLTTAFVPLCLETAPKDLRFRSFHSQNSRDRVKIVRRNFFKVAKNLPH